MKILIAIIGRNGRANDYQGGLGFLGLQEKHDFLICFYRDVRDFSLAVVSDLATHLTERDQLLVVDNLECDQSEVNRALEGLKKVNPQLVCVGNETTDFWWTIKNHPLDARINYKPTVMERWHEIARAISEYLSE